MNVHKDLETYSELDIAAGLDLYSKHPSTCLTMGAWAIDQEPVQQTDDVEYFLSVIRELAARNDTLFYAFNAPFERIMLREVGGIDIPIERWRCVMVHAYTLGFSGGLKQVGQQMGIAGDKAKLAEGSRLVQKFCKPAPRTHKVDRYTKENAPDAWEAFCEYNRQDVVAEREIEMLLAGYPMPQSELELWFTDQRINDRGMPVDRELVTRALEIFKEEKKHLVQRLKEATGLANPMSVQQLAGWFQAHEYPMVNFAKETVTNAIWHLEQLPPWGRKDKVIEVLKLRQQAARTAGAKWQALDRMTDWDTGRLRGAYQFYGAQRTGRWGGRGVQPHNLHRSPEDQDRKVDTMLSGDRAWVSMMYGNGMDVVASTIRAGFKAPPGKKLVVCDLGSIESRVLGWMSGCKRINDIFAEGKDTYRDFASELFEVPYDQVTKEQRTFCKPPVLGCGYRLGAGGLVKYAAGYGIEMSGKDAKHAVRTFREAYHEVAAMWEWLDDATKSCVQSGTVHEGYTVRIWRDDNFMFITLPSGRNLSYYQPLVQPRVIKIPDPETGEEREWHTRAVCYMGMDQYTHQWVPVASHGGKFTENIDQAISRDILAQGMVLAEREPLLEVIGHVHDEIICMADESNAETALERLRKCMVRVTEWALGLLLDASGYIALRYRKE